MKRFLFGAAVALVFALFVYPVFAAPSEVGVVLMHGKWGWPQSMSSLARELESKGYLVSNAEMAWSGRRLYDVDYPTALKEIEQEVQQLRAKGAKRVVVAGQSMGSNAAVACASSASISTGWWSYRRDIFQRAGWGNGCALVTSEQKHGRGESRRRL
jgi:dienelactone hydrolase